MRMEHPRLSIIVPVYNTAVFLPRCLESVIGQTYRNIEIICVDDGSTDDSLAVLQQYAAQDSRIKVLHQENAGVSAARNAGMKLANGEFLTFVDSDDWLELDAYEKILPCMGGGVDLVCFGGMIDGDVAPELLENMLEYARVKYSGLVPIVQGVRNTNVYGCMKVFRKSVIDAYHVQFPVGIACGEDAAFYFCYAAVSGMAYYLPEPFYHYVQQPGSAMAQFRKKSARGLDHLRVVEMVYDFYVKNGVLSKMQPLFDWIFASYYHVSLETTPQDMHAEVHQQAHALALNSGSIRNVRYGMIRDLRQRTMGRLERMFHWYVDNRECYGVGGRSVYSITYERDSEVHRLLGKMIKREPAEVQT